MSRCCPHIVTIHLEVNSEGRLYALKEKPFFGNGGFAVDEKVPCCTPLKMKIMLRDDRPLRLTDLWVKGIEVHSYEKRCLSPDYHCFGEVTQLSRNQFLVHKPFYFCDCPVRFLFTGNVTFPCCDRESVKIGSFCDLLVSPR